MLMESKLSGLLFEGKAQDRVAFGVCVVGLILSGAILWAHGSAHLLLSYPVVPPQAQVSGAVDAILKVSAERRSLLLELKAALLSNQEKLALRLARKYCGIEERNGD
jgi:hypothetical protein